MDIRAIIQGISVWAIPVIIASIMVTGFIKKVKIGLEEEGAQEVRAEGCPRSLPVLEALERSLSNHCLKSGFESGFLARTPLRESASSYVCVCSAALRLTAVRLASYL